MNINDILRAYRGIPSDIHVMNLDTDKKQYESKENYETCMKIIEEAGGKRENVYVTDAVMENVFYCEIESGTYISVSPFVPDMFQIVDFEKRLPVVRQSQENYLKTGNYTMFYFYIPDAMRVFDFEHRYKNLPQDRVSDIWSDVYTSIDYGFSQWKPEVIDYVLQHTPARNDEKRYTIYRGAGTKSTPIDKCYSWTTDINMALWFATKGVGKDVWKAEVSGENVAMFIDDRNEKEVIVAPEHIEKLERIDMYPADVDTLLGMIDSVKYRFYEFGELIPQIYDGTDGYHGAEHVVRVLLLALIIADKMEESELLDDTALDILATAAVFHDCGRENDCEDKNHGKASADRMKELFDSDIYYMNDKDIAVAYELVRCHSIPDEEGIQYIMENDPYDDKSLSILLYQILKDADALDRYRLGYYKTEFDMAFLRTGAARKLPLVSAGLYNGQAHKLILEERSDDNDSDE